MNLRQKLYDSNDSGNTLIKIKNSSSLSKNLRDIRTRKPIYINNINNSLSQRKNSKLDFEDYYRKKENKIINKIIGEIKTKKYNQVYNTEQNILINNSMKSKKNYIKLNNLALKKENDSFKKRINNQKPFISAKGLDKEYKDLNDKFNSKKKANKSLRLPPINNHK